MSSKRAIPRDRIGLTGSHWRTGAPASKALGPRDSGPLERPANAHVGAAAGRFRGRAVGLRLPSCRRWCRLV